MIAQYLGCVGFAPQVCILGEGAAQEMHTTHRAQDYNNYGHFTENNTCNYA